MDDDSRILMQVVASDLKFLYEEWDEEIDDASLRRSSNVLRMLLVDGNLLRAWQAAGFGGEPKIRAHTLDSHLERFGAENILFALAGGAVYKGRAINFAYVARERATDIRESEEWSFHLMKPGEGRNSAEEARFSSNDGKQNWTPQA